MKNLLSFSFFLFLFSFPAFSLSTLPKDSVRSSLTTYIDFGSKTTDNSKASATRISSKAGYNRYGIIGFDMKKVVGVRQKIELGITPYQSSSDDYFLTGVGDYPLAVYAMKRKPSMPTNYNRFFNPTNDATLPGDAFTLTGTLPKELSINDGQKLGVITLTKADKDKYVKLDVTEFVNKNIGSSDSIYFFLASDAPVADLVSLFIRSTTYSATTAPKLYCYDEKPIVVMQGGKNLYSGEKDSIHVFFPPSATLPFSLTYTNGTTPVTISNITRRNFAFQVAPTQSLNYSIAACSDANGALVSEGTASYTITTPTATLSGVNKIYAGQSTTLSVVFSGIAPFGFSYRDHLGALISKTGITTTDYSFDVAPTTNYTYSLTTATDKNNSSISSQGSVLVSVIAVPTPTIPVGAADWSVVSSDEFGKSTLDANMWSVTTGAPVVINDELRLPVNKSGTAYVASQIKLNDKLPNNTDVYLEARIKPLNAKGATTSIFTQTFNTTLSSKYENRYAMTFPSITYRANNQFDLYYNLDDWKTNYYASTINPNKQIYSVMDSIKATSISTYKVYGVLISTKDIVYYIDGVEVKRASNMANYNSGELVTALKSAGAGSALEDVAKKAYGYFGQADWNYNAGYTGDLLALLVGTSINTAEVDATIDGQVAAIDYFRVFKRTAELNTTPTDNITFNTAANLTLAGNASKDGNAVVLAGGGNATFSLNNIYDLNTSSVRYFSTIVKKGADAEALVSLMTSTNKVVAGVNIDQYNQIQTGFGSNKLYYASSVSAEPTGKKSTYIRNDEASLLVGRIQTSSTGDDYLSVSILPLVGDVTEPFYYPNIEGEFGHTSYNSDWDLNYRYEIGVDKLSKIKVQGNKATSTFQKFIVGSSFLSVLPKESFASIKPNLLYVTAGTTVNIEVELKGVAPWSLTYSDGVQNVTLNNITTSTINIPVAPTKTTTYSLVSLTDGNGLQGILSGKQLVKVKSAKAISVYPLNDTYVNATTTTTTYNTAATGQIKKIAPIRESYFRFDISAFAKTDSIDVASFSMYFLSNDKAAPVVLSLYSVEGGFPGDIIDLCWANKPTEVNYKFVSDIILPDPGTTGVRANWDVSKYINLKLRSGASSVDFCIRSTGGEIASLLTWRQYVATSTQYQSQFPMLEFDPFMATGIDALYSNENRLDELKIFPNPVRNGVFNIDNSFDASDIRIFNLVGDVVRNPVIVNGQVDVKGLDKGTYLIQLDHSGRRHQAKMIIQ
jgi:hypothetical protein